MKVCVNSSRKCVYMPITTKTANLYLYGVFVYVSMQLQYMCIMVSYFSLSWALLYYMRMPLSIGIGRRGQNYPAVTPARRDEIA